MPHFGEPDAALSAPRNTPNIGRIFGSLNKRPVAASTRPRSRRTPVFSKRAYPFSWATFSFVAVPGRFLLLVFSRSGLIRRLAADTTSGIHARWWHCFNNFSWESMSFVRRRVTFSVLPLLLFQRASPCAPGSWYSTSVSYSPPGLIPGPRGVLLPISMSFSLSLASPSPAVGPIIPLEGVAVPASVVPRQGPFNPQSTNARRSPRVSKALPVARR